MSTDQTLPFEAAATPVRDVPLELTPLEISPWLSPWSLGTEEMLPARHVVWISLGLILVSLLVLAFG
jgi:hypothetical protein